MSLTSVAPTGRDDDGARPLPAPPSLFGALRAGISDFYFNSWRVVPLNLLWGLLAGVVYLAGITYWPVAVVLAAALALPIVGLHRLAGFVTRGEDVNLSDGLGAMRELLA